MTVALPRDLRGTETFREVEALLRSMREPGVGRIVDATDLECSPDGSVVAFTAWRRTAVSSDPVATVGLLDVATGALRLLDDPGEGCSRQWPRWSPDGARLLCLRRAADAPDEPLVLDVAGGAAARVTPGTVRGRVEQLAWSPDGGSVALLVAEPGAEISDVFGSGRVGGGDELPDWCPEVAAEGRSGWRRPWVATLGGPLRPVDQPLNVWEFCWAGPRHLAAVSSREPDEDAWYDAELVLVAPEGGPPRLLHTPAAQLAVPAADALGRQVSVLAGTASDRGLLAGALVVVEVATGSAATVPTGGVHVTSQTWCGSDRILLAGLRDGATVSARCAVSSGDLEHEWVTAETFGPGDLPPAAVPCGERGAAVVLESHTRPPTCGIVGEGAFRPLLDLSHPGSAVAGGLCATLRPLSWRSTDGLSIDGYVATPVRCGPGPHPLVVLVHGDPSGAGGTRGLSGWSRSRCCCPGVSPSSCPTRGAARAGGRRSSAGSSGRWAAWTSTTSCPGSTGPSPRASRARRPSG